jgi:nucleoside-diphosphate-sugar epimerase
MSKKVFVTGCTGEIGSRLTLLLLENGYEVFGTSGSKICSINNPRHTCRQLNLLSQSEAFGIKEIQPDVLVHTAWLTKPREFWESDQNTEWVEASKRIINEFILSGGKYLIVTGSCAEYSWDTAIPLSEDSVELPTSAYGQAKLDLLNWIRLQLIPFLWTRTFFQFGMNEPEGRLIPSLIDSLHDRNEFVIRSSTDIRDFVYVEDVSKILYMLISQELTGVVNIGHGEEVQVGTITRKVSKLIGREELLRLEIGKNEKSYIVSDPKKLISLIGNYKWTPLETALKKTIEARKQ